MFRTKIDFSLYKNKSLFISLYIFSIYLYILVFFFFFSRPFCPLHLYLHLYDYITVISLYRIFFPFFFILLPAIIQRNTPYLLRLSFSLKPSSFLLSSSFYVFIFLPLIIIFLLSPVLLFLSFPLVSLSWVDIFDTSPSYRDHYWSVRR